MKVFILKTCRRPELNRMSDLVFETINVGFPTASIECFDSENTIHHKWIQQLFVRERSPFFICDTDVIFYDSFERFDFSDCALAGWRIPEWNDAFSGCITRARLHTSLLYINPEIVNKKLCEFAAKGPGEPFVPECNPFYPLVVPFKGRRYFYDTCSLLYHTIGGASFTDEQKDAYFHFNFGTISDIVLPRLSKDEASKMIQARECVLSNPSMGKGAWREQEEYYKLHPS